jgi:hypothetical protein
MARYYDGICYGVVKCMNLWDKANPQSIYAIVAEFEKAIKLPDGFCERLRDEDDWSFVIKLHALLEAAVTHLLVVTLGHETLMPIFARLELGQAQTGKLAFVDRLSLLDSQNRGFLRWLSEVRNQVVHDVRNVAFDLAAYVMGLDSNQRRKFLKAIVARDADNSVSVDDETFGPLSRLAKMLVWRQGLFVVAIIHLQADAERLRTESERSEFERLKTISKALQMVGIEGSGLLSGAVKKE